MPEALRVVRGVWLRGATPSEVVGLSVTALHKITAAA